MAGSTPLMAATMAGHADIVSRLIELGANASAVNRTGEPPLAIAVSRGYEDTKPCLRTVPQVMQMTESGARHC
jgi:ankyrin repeat protein